MKLLKKRKSAFDIHEKSCFHRDSKEIAHPKLPPGVFIRFKGRKGKHEHPLRSCSSFSKPDPACRGQRDASFSCRPESQHCLPVGPWASPVLLLDRNFLPLWSLCGLPALTFDVLFPPEKMAVALTFDLTGKTCQISRPCYLSNLHLHLHSFMQNPTPEFLGQAPSLIKCPLTSQWAHTL